jgi:hypothetical protein
MFKPVQANKRVYFNLGWEGNQQNSLIEPTGRQPFEPDYPFKKYFIGSDAPVLEDTKDFVRQGPPGLSVNVKIAIQMGKIYDLSQIERSRNRPILVSRLKSGKFRVITSNKDLLLSEDEMDQYRVPLSINDKIMKPMNLAIKEEVEANTLNVRFLLGPDAIPKYKGNGLDEGQAYIFLKKQNNGQSETYYSKILSAEIVTYVQLRAKRVIDFNGNLVADHTFLRDKIRMDFLDIYPKMGYRGVNSMREILGLGVGGVPLDNYGEFFKDQYLKNIAAPHTQIFGVLPGNTSTALRGNENVHDHLFLRV